MFGGLADEDVYESRWELPRCEALLLALFVRGLDLVGVRSDSGSGRDRCEVVEAVWTMWKSPGSVNGGTLLGMSTAAERSCPTM